MFYIPFTFDSIFLSLFKLFRNIMFLCPKKNHLIYIFRSSAKNSPKNAECQTSTFIQTDLRITRTMVDQRVTVRSRKMDNSDWGEVLDSDWVLFQVRRLLVYLSVHICAKVHGSNTFELLWSVIID